MGNRQWANENYVEGYLRMKQLSNRKRKTAVVSNREK